VAGLDVADELAPLVELARSVGDALRAAGLTLSTAESCTGGLIGHLLTEAPGSSDYYVGGLVSYSDALKQREFGVAASVLERHGAVSAQTCVAMADGARTRYGTDVGVAVTGIAGPSGGSAAKPIGLTYVAVADKAGHEVQRHQWSGDRHANKVASAGAALALLMERVAR
jgi:PncC family amidohydrolase